MVKSGKIAISLPKDLLTEIKRQCAARGESRSQFLRVAVEAYLRGEQDKRRVEQYVRGYQEMPESEEEVASAQTMAQVAFADNPWEGNGKR